MMNDKIKPITKLDEQIKRCEEGYLLFISHRLGIIATKQVRELNKIVKEACQKFNCNPAEYLSLLQKSTNSSPLLEHLVSGITIGETYFFRDKYQMQILYEEVLPELIQKKRLEKQLNLRIWSAGCSSGEEIYTIAMMLEELLPDINAWIINLLATDININAMQKGIKGCFSDWSMRSINPDYLRKYFTQKDRSYILTPTLRERVNFNYLNLKEDTYPSMFNSTNAQDLIICRNVMIYFDANHIGKMMTKFANCLTDKGYMLLGASDPILIDSTGLINKNRHSLLQKTTVEKKEIIKPNITVSIKPKKVIRPLLAKPVINADILTPLKKGEWETVLTLIKEKEIKEPKSGFVKSVKATALANLGKLDLAIISCKESLALDSTNKYTHYTYALALLELNQVNEAETEFRKTIFLDRKLIVAHFQLGLLLMKKNQRENGLKTLKTALSIALSEPKDKTVPGSNGIAFGRFSEILEQEINIYSIKHGESYANTN